MELLVVVVCGLCLLSYARADFDGRWPRLSSGLCRYGSRIDCCWGWARQPWGQCQPVCHPGCKHGECVGPNKCKCHPGYIGKTCSQDGQLHTSPTEQQGGPAPLASQDHLPEVGSPSMDLNECGLKPRPCKHRCMNTFGSYKCYCLNGYMLMPDGSCSNAHTCSMANCQYGCDVLKGEVRCRCPSPGLQLAPDGRTCLDVDECATGGAVCPRFRKCINTFGSYICKCHKGYDLLYIGGKYQCHDIDECASGAYQCSGLAQCYNTQGSYKCKCKEGYRGTSTDCTPVPKVWIDPSRPFLNGPEKNNRFKGNSTFFGGKGGQSNRIPDIVEWGTARPPNRPFGPVIITPKILPRTTPNPVPRTTPKPTPGTTTRPATTPTTRPARNPVTRPPPRPFTWPPLKTTTVTTATTIAIPKPTTGSSVIVTEVPVFPERITVDNRIQVDPQKPRGDVFIPPRSPGAYNDLFNGFEIEIERGLSADEYEARDDPGDLVNSCNFDSGLCGWIRERDDDLRWEPAKDPSGGQYLKLSELKGKGGRMARLILPIDQVAHAEDLCLSFRHKLSGLHSGTIQLFVKRNRAHGPPVWGRDAGYSWRQTHLTLKGSAYIKHVIFKGERGREGAGEIALDDVSLMKGSCPEAH